MPPSHLPQTKNCLGEERYSHHPVSPRYLGEGHKDGTKQDWLTPEPALETIAPPIASLHISHPVGSDLKNTSYGTPF